ncbi:MAG: putative sugar phosphatase superfamily [Rhodospirillales bacterium]|nr:putative sugar phosphatase superfamily [Rhodospirillales bacterium]
MSVKSLGGIRSLVDRYDTYVIDLWGTLHNGIVAYPGAIEALTRLKAAGKQITLLSNVPRRLQSAVELLEGFGIRPEMYDVMMTSGESVYRSLRDRPNDWYRKLSGACWHLGNPRDRRLFDGMELDLREEPDGAGFCVATGAKMNEERLEDYRKDLDRGLALGLPMICANPDIVVPVGDMLAICAGAFAEYYEGKGGDVCWHGKPHAPIYKELFAELEATGGGSIDPVRTLAIGDGLYTDVAGAAAAGIPSALLVGGVHRPELKINWRGKPDCKTLAALIDNADAKPNHVLRRFAW